MLVWCLILQENGLMSWNKPFLSSCCVLHQALSMLCHYRWGVTLLFRWISSCFPSFVEDNMLQENEQGKQESIKGQHGSMDQSISKMEFSTQPSDTSSQWSPNGTHSVCISTRTQTRTQSTWMKMKKSVSVLPCIIEYLLWSTAAQKQSTQRNMKLHCVTLINKDQSFCQSL